MRRLTLALLFRNTFGKVPMAPPDPILGISVAYNSDPDTRKVNLGVGAYRDDSLKPVVFSVVRKVEEQIVAEKLNKVRAIIRRSTLRLRDWLGSMRAARSWYSGRTLRSSRRVEW